MNEVFFQKKKEEKKTSDKDEASNFSARVDRNGAMDKDMKRIMSNIIMRIVRSKACFASIAKRRSTEQTQYEMLISK